MNPEVYSYLVQALSFIKNAAIYLQPFAVIAASVVAIYSINAWRRESIGKRRIELAEDVLAKFYEARDVIQGIRSPLSFEGEGGSRKRDDAETEQESAILDAAYIALERYKEGRGAELFSELRAMRYRCLVLYGEEIDCAFREVDKAMREIILAAQRIGWFQIDLHKQRRGTDTFREEKIMELQKIIWWSDPDPITERVDQAIADIERICRPIITKWT